MIREAIVFPFDKAYKTFEREVGEAAALRAEVELLRSVLMEEGKRDVITKGEREMYKRYLRNN